MAQHDYVIEFPINMCHQRVVTKSAASAEADRMNGFPINRCHQRVVTLIQSATM